MDAGGGGAGGTGGNGNPNSENGIVLASHRDQWLAVATKWGNQVFEAQTGYCPDVLKDDAVVFAQTTSSCNSNTFADLRTAKSCDVYCTSPTDAGQVTAVSDRTVTVMLRFEARNFELGLSCSPITGPVRVGDSVVFVHGTAVCLTNVLLDLRSGKGCDVRCL